MMDQWITPNLPTPAVNVSAPTNIATSENGNTASISIVLNTQPSADVNIDVSSSDITEGTINPANLVTLTFNDTNWNTAQTVTITGVDDGDVDGNVIYTIITNTVVTADTGYLGINPDDVTITNTDNEVVVPANITVTPTSGLTTSENGATSTFSVSLDTMPTDDVTIGISSSNTNEGTVSPSSLVFTSLDYAAKTVTVTGVDDGVQDGAQAYMVVTAPATSLDPEYSGRDASDVSVSNIDNEAGNPGVTSSKVMGIVTTEAGGQDTFTVVLASMPNADVTISVSSDELTEGTVAPATLTFDATNWDQAQTVTATGVDDTDIDLSQPYNITLVTSSLDLAYSAIANITVTATNEDNEVNVFAVGKVEYDAVINGHSCATCHGSEGLGTDAVNQNTAGAFNFPLTEGSPDCLRCGDQDMFEAYVLTNMPTNIGGGGTPLDCDATCAANITSYIYNGFSVVPPGL